MTLTDIVQIIFCDFSLLAIRSTDWLDCYHFAVFFLSCEIKKIGMKIMSCNITVFNYFKFGICLVFKYLASIWEFWKFK